MLPAGRGKGFVEALLGLRQEAILGFAMERLSQTSDRSAHYCALLD